MTVELRTEDRQLLQALVDSGQYSSLDEALHDSIVAFAGAPSEEYKKYLNDAIEEGLADVAAGRLVDGDEVMKRLKARANRSV